MDNQLAANSKLRLVKLQMTARHRQVLSLVPEIAEQRRCPADEPWLAAAFRRFLQIILDHYGHCATFRRRQIRGG